MKFLYYDCFSGISGDMNLGAMIDLGLEKSFLINELKKLKIRGWELVAERDQRHGIRGTRVTVKLTQHSHTERNLADIEKIINNSGLDSKTKELSKKIFRRIASAEAAVHGIPISKVHFHEVGAVDSIIDVAGAAICFNALGVDTVYVSAIELGGGVTTCDHGTLPVPAPATAEILKGLPVRTGGVDFEATTPTGAAILATLGSSFGGIQNMKIEKTGYGVGMKDHPSVPNLLRVFTGESEETSPGHDALLIECNIDDMNPEYFEHITHKLFKAGASDVYISNIIMKKGRPGSILSIICEPGKDDAVKDIVFSESTSLGIRTFRFRKDTLARKFEKVKTEFGNITIKRSFYKGREVSCKPEFEECRKIAEKTGIAVKEVYNRIIASILKQHSESI